MGGMVDADDIVVVMPPVFHLEAMAVLEVMVGMEVMAEMVQTVVMEVMSTCLLI